MGRAFAGRGCERRGGGGLCLPLWFALWDASPVIRLGRVGGLRPHVQRRGGGSFLHLHASHAFDADADVLVVAMGMRERTHCESVTWWEFDGNVGGRAIAGSADDTIYLLRHLCKAFEMLLSLC
ncbi:uncharacterized protein Tco025E_08973 [Trypanosoma conorhini]|uniref:Uncharacterized protein n=1 Tax=Trypanosoma conorhini TaxID=83891 RepID=A0A422N2E9_9TRYP|nr:uncharacterized protein Tco025E_08973 [Trypanosoma conorhini]RNE99630.1 hypothetical protein Tco025E_08973 [Trypanosoma conorhini]